MTAVESRHRRTVPDGRTGADVVRGNAVARPSMSDVRTARATGLSFGPLEEVTRDPSITDVAVTCEGRVWVDHGDGMGEYRPRMAFRSSAAVREYAVRLCAQLGRRLDDACPIADASTVGGIRVHAVIAPLVPQGASISIRFPDRGMPTLESLAARGMMPGSWLPVLHGLVARRATVLVTGGTGAGKTTLLKALLSACGTGERIVTVEEVRELAGLGWGNHVALASREANVEGEGAVGLPELVKATLRMRPDRVVLGECRGEEVVDLLRAFNSGHRGGMTTLHADAVERVPARLVSLGLLAGVDPRAMAALAHGAFDAILHLERHGGRRRIAQIGCLVHGRDGLYGMPLAVWRGGEVVSAGRQWEEFRRRWTGTGT